MPFTRIRFENIGPIEHAEIGRHNLSVFVGPNNAGKSIASRLMHGVCQLDVPAKAQPRPPGPGPDGTVQDGRETAAARSSAVLRSAGIGRRDVITHLRDSGRIDVERDDGSRTTMDFGRCAEPGRAAACAPHPGSHADTKAMNSIYVPAGRAGTVQALLAIVQIKNDICDSVLQSLGEPPGSMQGQEGSGGALQDLRLGRRMPEYLGQFYGVVLEALSTGIDGGAGRLFSRLFEGSAAPPAAGKRPPTLYSDPSGFGAEIDSAGSGVASALPIAAAMYRVKGGGTLTVEEPEAHMDPVGQMRLVNEVARAALERGVSLVLVTHSDFVVHAVLGMVHDEIMDPDDLGLYYFRRGRGECARVERIPVNRAGEAEMELFSEALDTLARGGAVPAEP